MEREIKFKAWHNKLLCFFDEFALYPDGSIGMDLSEFEFQLPEHLTYDGEEVTAVDFEYDDFKLTVYSTGEEWIFLDAEDIIILRFTGLKDKNGTEIYEGHIVKRTANMRDYCEADGQEIKLHQVQFSGIELLPFSETGIYMSEYEIIGNIHQNPDLL